MVFWVTSSTHPSTQQGFWSAPVPKQKPEYISLGSGGLGEPDVGRYLRSFLGPSGFVSKSLASCCPRGHPAQGCWHVCPNHGHQQAFPQSFCRCLEGGRPPSTAQVQQFFAALAETTPLCPFSPLSYTSSSSWAHSNYSSWYWALFSFTPNQRIAPSVLCSRRIYFYAAQNQTDALTHDMAENTIFLLCFDRLAFISIFWWGWYVNNRE